MGSAQLSLWGERASAPAVYDYGTRSSGEAHGAVQTRPQVVALALDLAGYTEDKDLGGARLLEPACGRGAFLVEAVERLMRSASRWGRAWGELEGCVRALDVDAECVRAARERVGEVLGRWGMGEAEAQGLLEAWISEGDFLLRELGGRFDVVAGNPPYVRVEQIPSGLLARYRAKYRTLYDRADLYVAFFERALGLLAEGGRLAYVCSDRWTLNKYGGPLRGLVASSHHVMACLDLGEARPFESEVIAYPALFVLRRGPSAGPTWVGKLKRGDEVERRAVLAALTHSADGPQVALGGGAQVARRAGWFKGEEPWVLGGDARVGVLRGLEASFAPLEQTAKVGIGVATGCDRLYLVGPEVDLEPSRRVPLVMREDLRGGKVGAPRLDVVDTFEDDGSPVDLGRYPRLAAYLRAHEEELRARYVAKKNPRAWFRTIDRVYPALTHTPKLLIPDIAGANEVALDEGGRYPHHNLYFITSSRWDMEVLGGLLASKVALFFVWSYAPKMRGGYLRFQAQYLKRIRLPDPDTLSARLTDALRAAFRARDYPTLDALALEAYALAELPPFDFTDTRR